MENIKHTIETARQVKISNILLSPKIIIIIIKKHCSNSKFKRIIPKFIKTPIYLLLLSLYTLLYRIINQLLKMMKEFTYLQNENEANRLKMKFKQQQQK